MTRPNELDLPLERIEEALIQCAIPGFYGEVRFEIKVLQTAALEVELLQERKTLTQKDTARDDGPIVPSNDRTQRVRARLPEIQSHMRIVCPVSTIRALFKDGNLVTLEFTEVKDLRLIDDLPLVGVKRF